MHCALIFLIGRLIFVVFVFFAFFLLLWKPILALLYFLDQCGNVIMLVSHILASDWQAFTAIYSLPFISTDVGNALCLN